MGQNPHLTLRFQFPSMLIQCLSSLLCALILPSARNYQTSLLWDCTGLLCCELDGKALLCLEKPTLLFMEMFVQGEQTGQCCAGQIRGAQGQGSALAHGWALGAGAAAGTILGTGCCLLWVITTSELPVDFYDLVPVKRAVCRALCSQFISALRHRQIPV